ncbi:MAG: type II toxin-antitoxin system VapC family toxin [Bacteroidia bacterium]|nr:type II toxin-antitoxin system VapC family toxin [Bacteroidia bacterium]
MNYLLDTNILVGYVRDKQFSEKIRKDLNFPNADDLFGISVVSLGELRSLALRRKWGQPKKMDLKSLVEELIILDINSEDIIDKYAEIEAFSQNELAYKPLKTSARNMGKNDLWIAATASVTQAQLVTTDKDFDHLRDYYLDIYFIDVKNY